MLPFFLAVIGQDRLHQSPNTQDRPLRIVMCKVKIIQPKKVVAQTCEDIVGFPPETNLALHSSHLVLAVSLKYNVIEIHQTVDSASE